MGRWRVMLQQERKSGTSSEKDAALKVSTARDAQFKGSYSSYGSVDMFQLSFEVKWLSTVRIVLTCLASDLMWLIAFACYCLKKCQTTTAVNSPKLILFGSFRNEVQSASLPKSHSWGGEVAASSLQWAASLCSWNPLRSKARDQLSHFI